MILLSIQTISDRPEDFDTRIAVEGFRNAEISEVEMLATLLTFANLTKDPDTGFLTPEQYERFKEEVVATFKRVASDIHRAADEQRLQGMGGRRN
jgi:hypothetical protein